MESIQKSAVKIAFPSAETYSEAVKLARLETLANRRIILCRNYMNKMYFEKFSRRNFVCIERQIRRH